MNKYVKSMVRFCKDQLGKPYVFGQRGPKAFDCIGLMYTAARHAGLDSMVFPNSWTVRNLASWARNHGRLVLSSDGTNCPRGAVFIWGSSGFPDHHPIKGAGHTGLVLQPVSAGHPKGKALSAYNPNKGVIIHDLIPEPGHLALYGFVDLPYPVDLPPTEIEDSAPPDDAAVEQPDDELPEPPTVEELLAKIEAAKEALA